MWEKVTSQTAAVFSEVADRLRGERTMEPFAMPSNAPSEPANRTRELLQYDSAQRALLALEDALDVVKSFGFSIVDLFSEEIDRGNVVAVEVWACIVISLFVCLLILCVPSRSDPCIGRLAWCRILVNSSCVRCPQLRDCASFSATTTSSYTSERLHELIEGANSVVRAIASKIHERAGMDPDPVNRFPFPAPLVTLQGVLCNSSQQSSRKRGDESDPEARTC